VKDMDSGKQREASGPDEVVDLVREAFAKDAPAAEATAGNAPARDATAKDAPA